ncbi:pilus assembly protein TadG-related protein [Kribbella sp. NPDC059898]|uniref:pilus assembly protein TadG-related protein n=1 Tax=Kribbella sp. NPDC059898 TaxID=3346995 RepID=UPI003646510B
MTHNAHRTHRTHRPGQAHGDPWASQRRYNERGSMSLFFIVVVIALLGSAGLVVDGARQVSAQRHAQAAAEDAARAGGQAISSSALTGQSQLSVDTGRAAAAARSNLAAAGVDGAIAVNGTTLTVSTTTNQSTVFLSMFGIDSFTVHGRATARLAQGGF